MILVALFALLAAATARGRRLFAAALVVCAAPSPPSPLSFSVEARALTLLLARPNGATHAFTLSLCAPAAAAAGGRSRRRRQSE